MGPEDCRFFVIFLHSVSYNFMFGSKVSKSDLSRHCHPRGRKSMMATSVVTPRSLSSPRDVKRRDRVTSPYRHHWYGACVYVYNCLYILRHVSAMFKCICLKRVMIYNDIYIYIHCGSSTLIPQLLPWWNHGFRQCWEHGFHVARLESKSQNAKLRWI